MKNYRLFPLFTITTLLSLLFAGTTFAASGDWQAAYKKFVYDKSFERIGVEYDDPKGYPYPDEFALYDIDGNGIPELFYGEWQSKDVYTFQGNTVKFIGQVFSNQNTVIIPEENRIVTQNFSFTAEGEFVLAKKYISNGKLLPDIDSMFDLYSIDTYSASKVYGNSDIIAYAYYGQMGATFSEKNHIYIVDGKKADRKTYENKEKEYLYDGNYRNLEYHLVMERGYDIPGDLEVYVTERSLYKPAQYSLQPIYLNDSKIDLNSYLIDGNNYCKLRDIAYALKQTDSKFDVSWSDSLGGIIIRTNIAYTGAADANISRKTESASVYNGKIFVNSKEIFIKGYNINGNNYFKLRDLAQSLNFSVEWNSEDSYVQILTAGGVAHSATAADKKAANEAYLKFLATPSEKTYAVTDPSTGKAILTSPIKPECFFLADLNNDGIPELIVGEYGWGLSNGEKWCEHYSVFTYKNNSVTFLDSGLTTFKDPTMYLVDKTTIASWNGGTSGYVKYHHTIYDGEKAVVNQYERIENGYKIEALKPGQDYYDGFDYKCNGETTQRVIFDNADPNGEKIKFIENTPQNRTNALR